MPCNISIELLQCEKKLNFPQNVPRQGDRRERAKFGLLRPDVTKPSVRVLDVIPVAWSASLIPRELDAHNAAGLN